MIRPIINAIALGLLLAGLYLQYHYKEFYHSRQVIALSAVLFALNTAPDTPPPRSS